jgi:hypothetical protein
MTRMWIVKPKCLCKNHLLGEHKELHQAVGSILAGKSLKGHIAKGQLEIHNIKSRHKKLAEEMLKRGYKHNSPLKNFKAVKHGKINKKENYIELSRRCKTCRELINANKTNIRKTMCHHTLKCVV